MHAWQAAHACPARIAPVGSDATVQPHRRTKGISMHTRTLSVVATALLSTTMVWAAVPTSTEGKPALAPVRPVTETLWGKKVTDNYRYMETLDPATLDWMKAEGHYTRSVLDSIKPLADLKTRVANFTASFGLVQDYASFGGRAFYEERAPGSDNFDLMVK